MPKLKRNVYVEGTWYGPAHSNEDVDQAVADKVDASAFEDSEDTPLPYDPGNSSSEPPKPPAEENREDGPEGQRSSKPSTPRPRRG